jgi:shikimate kinase
MPIVLIGPPGAGKSTVGPVLAGRLKVAFRDTDADVESAAGKPVADIFIEDGEDAFRELERQAVLKVLSEPAGKDCGVLAIGSGAVLDEQVLQALQDQETVVYLAVDFSAVVKHAGLDKPRIVLPGNPRGRLRAMLDERRPLYEQLATFTVENAGELHPEEVADQILTGLGLAGPGLAGPGLAGPGSSR